MRLISCHIENFGRLRGFDYIFSEGLNTFFYENGWGKSTFAAFLCAMLYGLPASRRKQASENLRERYRPWQGGVYGGSITFETEGKGYVAYKTFGKTRSGDVFKLIDTKTNLASLDYSEKLGEEIFLLDRESYLKSVFISQNECAGKLTDRIRARLSNLTQVSGDVEQSEKAIKELESFLLKHSFNRKGSRGHELVSELTELNVELAKYRNIDENYDNTLGELDDYKNRQAWILEDTNQSNFFYGQMEGLKLTDEETERFEALRNKHVDELSINEIDALISTKAGKNRKRKLVFAALECLGVVMIIAAIGVILADIVPVGITLAVLGAVSFIVGIFLGRTGSEDTFLSALKTEREEYERNKREVKPEIC